MITRDKAPGTIKSLDGCGFRPLRPVCRVAAWDARLWLSLATLVFASACSSVPLRQGQSGLILAVVDGGDAPLIEVYSLERSGDICFRRVGADRSLCAQGGEATVRGLIASLVREVALSPSEVTGFHSTRIQIRHEGREAVFSADTWSAAMRENLDRVGEVFDRSLGQALGKTILREILESLPVCRRGVAAASSSECVRSREN